MCDKCGHLHYQQDSSFALDAGLPPPPASSEPLSLQHLLTERSRTPELVTLNCSKAGCGGTVHSRFDLHDAGSGGSTTLLVSVKRFTLDGSTLSTKKREDFVDIQRAGLTPFSKSSASYSLTAVLVFKGEGASLKRDGSHCYIYMNTTPVADPAESKWVCVDDSRGGRIKANISWASIQKDICTRGYLYAYQKTETLARPDLIALPSPFSAAAMITTNATGIANTTDASAIPATAHGAEAAAAERHPPRLLAGAAGRAAAGPGAGAGAGGACAAWAGR